MYLIFDLFLRWHEASLFFYAKFISINKMVQPICVLIMYVFKLWAVVFKTKASTLQKVLGNMKQTRASGFFPLKTILRDFAGSNVWLTLLSLSKNKYAIIIKILYDIYSKDYCLQANFKSMNIVHYRFCRTGFTTNRVSVQRKQLSVLRIETNKTGLRNRILMQFSMLNKDKMSVVFYNS